MNDISHFGYRDTAISHDEYGQKITLNSDGYRSPEFKNNIDILALGCSMTFGVGVNQQAVWPAILSEKINLEYNNLSETGAAPMHIILNAFKYMEKYGNPKNIIAVFPDFNRYRIPLDGKVFKQNDKTNIIADGFVNHKKPKYFKLPIDPDNIFTDSYTEYLNFAFIKMLEQYCNANKIKLIWTSWIKLTKVDKKILRDMFNNFYYVGQNAEARELSLLNCHKEYKEKFPDCFNHATDGGLDDAHFGVHWQVHIAEEFEKILNGYTRN